MWKSKERKRKDQFEIALLEMVPAATQIAEKWHLFSDTLKFREGVSLAEQIRAFSMPLAGFLQKAYPNIAATNPIVYFSAMLIGVYLAKTNPIPELLSAAGDIEADTGLDGLAEMLANFIRTTPNR